MQYCPRVPCGSVGTEIVMIHGAEIPFCAHHAAEERDLLAGVRPRARKVDPFGMSRAAVALTRLIPAQRRQENVEGAISVDFNDLGEPVKLRIGKRRYRVYPR
jgi:hypothetical protein